jgi:hypothetical protein
MGHGARGFRAGQDALDLMGLVDADHDGETARAVDFGQLQPLLV